MLATVLPDSKIAVVAKVAAALIVDWHSLPDKRIAEQLIAEGIRKIHDHAASHRGIGKYRGHAHWSRDALYVLDRSGGALGRARSELTHEHVVPVRTLVGQLVSLGSSATPEACASVIKSRSIVAVITKAEDALLRMHKLHNTMPSDWDGKDLWARYRVVGLYDSITDA